MTKCLYELGFMDAAGRLLGSHLVTCYAPALTIDYQKVVKGMTYCTASVLEKGMFLMLFKFLKQYFSQLFIQQFNNPHGHP